MQLTIHSPERTVVKGISVSKVTLTTSEGEMEVLPGHACMAGKLDTGSFSYRTSDDRSDVGFISTGFFDVDPEGVTVMAETLELQSEIDRERAAKAQKKAEDELAKGPELPQMRKYQLKLQRSLIRQQLAK